MPIFVYILLGIALLITLILFSKVRLFICYEDSLRIYAKFWFFKISIFPKKKKKKKKSPVQQRTPTTTTTTPQPQPKKESILKKLWKLRVVLVDLISQFLEKLHFRFIKLRILVACDNAAKTALVFSGASQGVAYIIGILSNISNVDVTKNSDVSVDADFISLESQFESKIELYIRVCSLISVGFHALKEYVKHKSNTKN